MRFRVDLRKAGRTLRRNLLLKVFSVVFAVGLWTFVNLGARDAEQTLSVPIELRDVPTELVVTSPLVEAVVVRLRGPRTLLGTIDERRLRFPLNLGSVRPGTIEFKIDPEVLGLPRGVRVTRVSPIEVQIEVEKIVQRRLPVELGPDTMVPEGYRLAGVEIRPRSVTVSGPRSEVEPLEAAVTAGLELHHSGPTTFGTSVPVERSSHLVQVSPERVEVRGRLEDVEIQREFPAMAIAVRNADGPVRVSPPTARVALTGPQRILEAFQPGSDRLYVDVAGLGKGRHEVSVATQLPEGVSVSKVEPAEVTVEITTASAPTP